MQTAISHTVKIKDLFRKEAIETIETAIRQRLAINKPKRLPMTENQQSVIAIFNAYKYRYSQLQMASFLVRKADTLISIMPASNPPAMYKLKRLIAEAKQTNQQNQ
jgi:hypothetical protein